MVFSSVDPAVGASEPPGDFTSNYRHLKRTIDRALKEGTPLEELQLIPRDHSSSRSHKKLSREDLLRLLHLIRSIKLRYQRLLECPVPKELERDILAKSSEERLPWETEALEKIDQWKRDVAAVRSDARQELNDHLKNELFKETP